MCAYLPVRGSIFELASRFVCPSIGFTMGWTYFFAGLMLVCTELSAIATVMQSVKPFPFAYGISNPSLLGIGIQKQMPRHG